MPGIFTISLDFELHWGGAEKWPVEEYKSYFTKTRSTIPEMLKLFRKYDVHVTWATVGMLFHKRKSELLANAPKDKPTYLNERLSTYNYISTMGIGEDESTDPFHFAPSLIEQIASTPNQEIGSHTFSHFYCNEPGQTLNQFREDLRAARRASETYGLHLKSLVFPRNQFNEDYARICYEEGFTSVRTNPVDWFWKIDSTQRESIWKRINRGADAYFPIGNRNSYPLSSVKKDDNTPVALPASRLLRPYNPSELLLNTVKINRIIREMERAAETQEVYHLWWHPHNFGHHPGQNLQGLEVILKHFDFCRRQFKMESLNMCETVDRVPYGR